MQVKKSKQWDLVLYLRTLKPDQRSRLKGDVLSAFRRAEIRSLAGKPDDRSDRSLHKEGQLGVIKLRG